MPKGRGIQIPLYLFSLKGCILMKEKALPDDGLLLSNDLLKGDFSKNDDDKNS